MSEKRCRWGLVWITVLTTAVQGATLTVAPYGTGNFTAVQPAIDNATDGDEVVVYPGTYYGPINFSGKRITVRGSNPADPMVVAATILNANTDNNSTTYEGPAVSFRSGETRQSVLSGLSITGGSGRMESYLRWGGGILCDNSSPTLIHLRIYANSPHYGGGICCRDSAPFIGYCTIAANTATNAGGGIQCLRSPGMVIASNLIVNNAATASTGGGIDVYDCAGAGPRILNNAIANNSAGDVGGGICIEAASPDVENNIVFSNTRHGIYGNGTIGGAIAYNDVKSNSPANYGGSAVVGTGSISQDPLFADADGPDNNTATWVDNDYHLQITSPCVNAGSNAAAVLLTDTTTRNGTTATFEVGDASKYALGDEIEYNGDGVLRTITAIDTAAHALTVDAPLASASLAGKSLKNYGQGDMDGDDRINSGTVDMGADETKRVHNVTRNIWHGTVQDAIDNATAGDDLVLDPGIYTGDGNRDIDFRGKAITVRGSNPDDPNVVAATVIDCQGSSASRHRAFYFHSGETSTSVISGLTITHGYAATNILGGAHGGGVHCIGSSPLVEKCVFDSNSTSVYVSDADGGGIYLAQSTAVIRTCTFIKNNSEMGGGIACVASRPIISGCRFAENHSGYNGDGGGISADSASSPVVDSCIFTGNSFSAFWCSGGTPIIRNCIFSGNKNQSEDSTWGGGIHCEGDGTIVNCILVGNACQSMISALGGGIYCSGKTAISNCILVSNWTGGTPNCKGGGIYCAGGTVTITNCTIWGNKALYLGIGGGTCGGTLVNSIVWGNTAASSPQLAGPAGVSYSCIQDWMGGGAGNVALDPAFMGGTGGAWTAGAIYDPRTLQTVLTDATAAWTPGQWAGKLINPDTTQLDQALIVSNTATTLSVWGNVSAAAGKTYQIYDYHLQPTSPCVNTGSNAAAVVFADITTADGTTTAIRVGDTSRYAVGDEIEYGNDTVLRTLTAVDNATGTVTFDAALRVSSLEGQPVKDYGPGDLDGNDRIVFGRVDMGAYESPVWTGVHNVTRNTWYTTIQDAIDNAGNGDDIVLSPGVYSGPGNGSFAIDLKVLTIRSANPDDPDVVASTVIDSEHTGTGIQVLGGVSGKTTISGLTVLNGVSSGIYVSAVAHLVLSHCVIRDSSGYGIDCYHGLEMTECTVTRNGKRGVYGHSFYNSLSITDCVIADNAGGVGCYTFGSLSITRSRICGNSGVGVAVGDDAVGWVSNCLIDGNSGGGILVSYTGATVQNCTVTRNSSSSYGGGILCALASATVKNSILWGNSAPSGSQVALDTNSTIRVSWSHVAGGKEGIYQRHGGNTIVWGSGNLSDDPLFVDPDGPDNDPATWQDNDYHLQSASPALNAGNNIDSAAFSDSTTAVGTATTILVASIAGYDVGDAIEYDGDTVLRRVTAVDNASKAVSFSPSLAGASQAGKPINNYGGGDLDGNDRILCGRVDLGAYETAGSGLYVYGTCLLADYLGDKSQVPITITVLASPGESHSVTADDGGHYSFATARQGTYDLTAQSVHWLKRRQSQVPLGTNPVNFTLVNGDIDGNNAVNGTDLAVALAALDGTSPALDLDGDQQVTSSDLSIVLAGMGQEGDE